MLLLAQKGIQTNGAIANKQFEVKRQNSVEVRI